jgi:DUF4097 and DUF4098 domain-containing protein YvlB
VTIKSTNSEIRVAGIQGAFRAETTNGEITGTALGNGADVRSVNGTITLDLARLGDTGVRCHLTNGDVTVTVPADARADIDASVVNGDIRADKLNIAFKEQSARKLKGTIGGGGPNVRIEMINGDVRLIGR